VWPSTRQEPCGLTCMCFGWRVKDQRRSKRRERRSQIRDRDGFVLIAIMHMYNIYESWLV
jgi:hypothetical protein